MNANQTYDAEGPRDRATDPITDIRPELAVFTLDGQQLGVVKKVDGDVFQVDAAMRPDYWLRRSEVLSFNAQRVTMNFTTGAEEQHRVSR